MKLLLYTDVHFSKHSSIIRSRSTKYSSRLENCIKSVSWAEQQAIDNNCDEVICLGDFFNTPDLTSEELTALNEVQWANIPHTFIVGNHDASNKDLVFNSVNALVRLGFNVVNQVKFIKTNSINLLLIPYMEEDIRKSIKEYKDDLNITDNNLIVLSHNNVRCQYGRYENKTGFEIEDIEQNCKLFLNGHIHHFYNFCRNGFNLGNLTGQNFTEDAFTYPHCAFILDTNDNSFYPVENPYAYNFYQIEIDKKEDFKIFNKLKNQAVISVKCEKDIIAECKEYIHSLPNIVESKVIWKFTQVTPTDTEELTLSSLANLDHLQKLKEFVVNHLGSDEIVLKELQNIIN